MLLKSVLALLLVLIIGQLLHALWLMIRPNPAGVAMSRPLGRRLLLSVLVVGLLLLALAFGWIVPNPRPY